MKVKLISQVPTAYQYSSISNLMGGSNVQKLASGGFYAEIIFQTIKDARQWMRQRAEYLYYGERKIIKKNLGKNWIEYDAATASLRKLNC